MKLSPRTLLALTAITSLVFPAAGFQASLALHGTGRFSAISSSSLSSLLICVGICVLLILIALACGYKTFEAEASESAESALISERRPEDPDDKLTLQNVVQFSCARYYAEEGKDESVFIDIIRLGDFKGAASVGYRTVDCTAQAPEKYTSVEGRVVFGDGEHTKSIEISIVDDDIWSIALEFKVMLADPEHCVLDKRLQTCRVSIIDDDVFPTNKYREQIENGELSDIFGLGLFIEYCKLNFGSAAIRRRTLSVLLGDQLHSLNLFGTLFLSVYIVDTIFATHDPTSEGRLLQSTRYQTALLVCVWYCVPTLLLHVWDVGKTRLNICGKSRTFLQRNLLTKFLSYSQSSRDRVQYADLVDGITHDSMAAVAGYEATMDFARVMSRFVVYVVFVVLFQNDWLALGSIIMLPSLLAAVTVARYSELLEADAADGQMGMHILSAVQEATAKVSLILDYERRTMLNDKFQDTSSVSSEASNALQLVMVNSDYVPQWFGNFFLIVYIVCRAQAVLDGRLRLGLFLAQLTILEALKGDAISLNETLSRIVASIDPLRNITELFALGANHKDLKSINRSRRARTIEERARIFRSSEGQDHYFKTDLMRIQVVNLCFGYQTDNLLFQNINVSVQQGSFVALVGKQHGCGMSSFLELLASRRIPTSGEIFFPAHLRLIYVSHQPMFLDELSPWENLTLGIPNPGNVAKARIRKILELIDMPKTLHAVKHELNSLARVVTRRSLHLDEWKRQQRDMKKNGSWLSSWSFTQLSKLHLARALVADPEVLILQRPLLTYEANVRASIARLLRDHVRNRGLCQPPDQVEYRRPRTVFFNPVTTEEARAADVVWELDSEQKTVIEKAPMTFAMPGERGETFEQSK